MRTTARLARWFGVAGILLLLPTGARAVTQPVASPQPVATHGTVSLQTGSGEVLSLKAPVTNVFVADPKVVEVRPASPTTLFMFGVGAGRTTIAAMDSGGHLVAQYEVTVQPSGFDAAEAQSAIARLIPGSRVKVQAQQKGMLLTGSVNSPEDAAQAVAIAKGYASGKASKIDNEVVIRSPIQVTLMVRMAEMSRGVIQNLGINWQALGSIGSWNFGFFTPANLAAGNGAGSFLANVLTKGGPNQFSANAIIDALAGDNLAHILAEPNLTVLSGQTASFQAGGEFPIPISEINGAISIEFKSFGVMLKFTPTVMSDGRINLHVSPEYSVLDKADGVPISSGNSSIVVPALTVRRAQTTVQLGSGQSFAIAGLLEQTTNDASQGLPGIGNVPVLGALFRSNTFQRQESELVILVTPYIVRPVNNIAKLHLPTDGYTPASAINRLLMMRQTAVNQPPVPVRIPGHAGFIVR